MTVDMIAMPTGVYYCFISSDLTDLHIMFQIV